MKLCFYCFFFLLLIAFVNAIGNETIVKENATIVEENATIVKDVDPRSETGDVPTIVLILAGILFTVCRSEYD